MVLKSIDRILRGALLLLVAFLSVLPTIATAQEGTVVFMSNRDGNWEIYRMSADGTNQVRLTSNSASDFWPRWSPDGQRIVFMSDRDGNPELYTMMADGASQSRVTVNAFADEHPDWSPDGSKIVFNSDRNGHNIYTANTDGSNEIKLTSLGGKEPRWSPDGTKIAFVSWRDGNGEIYTMNADGSNQVRLTYNGAADWHPVWSPDGSKIVWRNDRDGNYEIYTMNADGSNQTRLTFNGAEDASPVFGRDGRIMFTSERDGNSEIYVMNPDGSNQTRLTSITSTEWEPAWHMPYVIEWVQRGANGHYYAFVPADTFQQGITWSTAESAANALASPVPGWTTHLATVGDEAENLFLFELATATAERRALWTYSPYGGSLWGPWLGGVAPPNRSTPASGWSWVTSEAWSFAAWASGEPNNGFPGGDENRVAFCGNGVPQPLWNDLRDDPYPGDGGRVRAYLVEAEPVGHTLNLASTSVASGSVSSGSVTFAQTGPTQRLVLMSDNSDYVLMSTYCIVPANQTTGTFKIWTYGVANTTVATITAEFSGVTRTANLTLTPATLDLLWLSPTAVVGGNPSMGNVRLIGKAPVGGAVVALATSNPAAANHASSVTISYGASLRQFPVSTFGVDSTQNVTISATYLGVTRTALISVRPAALSALSLATNTVKGGNPVVATVTMTGKTGPLGRTVFLLSNQPKIIVPGSMYVPPQKFSWNFTVLTQAVTSNTVGTITATQGATTRTATLTLTP